MKPTPFDNFDGGVAFQLDLRRHGPFPFKARLPRLPDDLRLTIRELELYHLRYSNAMTIPELVIWTDLSRSTIKRDLRSIRGKLSAIFEHR